MRLAALGIALALAFLPLTQAAASKAKVHGFSLTGTVARVDEGKKTLVVRNAAGTETSLTWTNATHVVGGRLAAGQPVTLRYLDRDGKHIATSIRIGPQPAPQSSPQLTPTPTPAPAPR